MQRKTAKFKINWNASKILYLKSVIFPVIEIRKMKKILSLNMIQDKYRIYNSLNKNLLVKILYLK